MIFATFLILSTLFASNLLFCIACVGHSPSWSYVLGSYLIVMSPVGAMLITGSLVETRATGGMFQNSSKGVITLLFTCFGLSLHLLISLFAYAHLIAAPSFTINKLIYFTSLIIEAGIFYGAVFLLGIWLCELPFWLIASFSRARNSGTAGHFFGLSLLLLLFLGAAYLSQSLLHEFLIMKG